jgi:hypothetical protein
LGQVRWELYLTWDTISVNRGADLDLWVIEPDGNLYIPYLGTVSPNGHFTAESYGTGAFYEGYMMKRFAKVGRYKFYADLWVDPQNVSPFADIQYREGPSTAFASIYAPNYPRLSRSISWRSDPTVTLAKIEAGQYTDLRYMAYLDIGPAASPGLSPTAPAVGAATVLAGQPIVQDLTDAQWRLVEQIRTLGESRRDGAP